MADIQVNVHHHSHHLNNAPSTIFLCFEFSVYLMQSNHKQISHFVARLGYIGQVFTCWRYFRQHTDLRAKRQSAVRVDTVLSCAFAG